MYLIIDVMLHLHMLQYWKSSPSHKLNYGSADQNHSHFTPSAPHASLFSHLRHCSEGKNIKRAVIRLRENWSMYCWLESLDHKMKFMGFPDISLSYMCLLAYGQWSIRNVEDLADALSAEILLQSSDTLEEKAIVRLALHDSRWTLAWILAFSDLSLPDFATISMAHSNIETYFRLVSQNCCFLVLWWQDLANQLVSR